VGKKKEVQKTETKKKNKREEGDIKEGGGN
jgi:hypothetical protein